MRDREVAAGRHGGEQPGHDRVRVVAVRYRVQDRDERDRDRPGEVEQPGGLVEDGLGVAQAGVDVLRGAGVAARQQRAGVGQDNRVVVGLDDPGLGRGGSPRRRPGRRRSVLASQQVITHLVSNHTCSR